MVTRSGKVLKDVIFLMADKESVMIRHDGATIEKWPLADMPEEVQKAYHFDAAKAAEAKKDREIEELKKQLAEAKKNATPAGTPRPPMPTPTPAVSTPDYDSSLAGGKLVPLDVIAADYNANRPAAEAKYRGRRFKISGQIDRIDKDMAPRVFNVFLKSTDGRTRFKLITEFESVYNSKRDKVGSLQTDFKIDLVDGKMIGVQRTSTLKGYYDYYYYYGSRRTIDKNKSPFAPILTVGDQITVTATCGGKTVSIDFANCAYEGLKLPFLTP